MVFGTRATAWSVGRRAGCVTIASIPGGERYIIFMKIIVIGSARNYTNLRRNFCAMTWMWVRAGMAADNCGLWCNREVWVPLRSYDPSTCRLRRKVQDSPLSLALLPTSFTAKRRDGTIRGDPRLVQLEYRRTFFVRRQREEKGTGLQEKRLRGF